MKSVYVAGRDFSFAEDTMECLRDAGYVITLDWTKYPKGLRDRWAAELMIQGVRVADVVVLCGWHDQFLGALVEVGAALGLHKPVILYGDGQRDSLFWQLSEVRRAESFDGLLSQLELAIPAR